MEDWEQFHKSYRRVEEQRREQERVEQQKKTETEENQQNAIEFVSKVAQPAFREIQKELINDGMTCDVVPKGPSITIHIVKPEGLPTKSGDFSWTVEAHPTSSGIVVKASSPVIREHPIRMEQRVYRAGDSITSDDICKSFRQDFSSALRP